MTPVGSLALTKPLDGAQAAQPSGSQYQAVLPIGAAEVQQDDVLRVAGSVRDRQLVGRGFRISDAAVGSYSVVRIVRLEGARLMPANPRPTAHPLVPAFRDPIALSAAPARLGPAMRARTRTITQHHAMLLRVRIQRHASGRPGPNVITG